MLSNLALCNVLRRAGYKPYARMKVLGRSLELISYPFPSHTPVTAESRWQLTRFIKYRGAVACMVREPGDPTTMFEWSIPDHVIKAALESFG